MRARQAQPFDQLSSMLIVAQEVKRRAVRQTRDLRDAVSIRHERAVCALRSKSREIGLSFRIGGFERAAPAHALADRLLRQLAITRADRAFGNRHEPAGPRLRRLHPNVDKPRAARRERKRKTLEVCAMRQPPIAAGRIGDRNGARRVAQQQQPIAGETPPTWLHVVHAWRQPRLCDRRLENIHREVDHAAPPSGLWNRCSRWSGVAPRRCIWRKLG
jgi:hypothetical protein